MVDVGPLVGPRLWAGALAASLAMLTLGRAALVAPAAIAVQLGKGTTHFVGVPRLVSARATQTNARAWGGKYYFTVQVPEDASEPLGRLVIQQHEGSSDGFGRLELDRTVAFGAGDRAEQFALEAIRLDPESRSITVEFARPVAPGETVELGLVPLRTPQAGIYLFGVTAFPAGEAPVGQFLGYGRLHFYDNRDHPMFWRP